MQIKIALPKGSLLTETAALLEGAGWGLSGYHEGARLYRLESERFPHLSAKVFQEKDVPIQVAVGNYDLGICGLGWIEELLSKYPSSGLVKVKNLGYGEVTLYIAGSRSAGCSILEEIKARQDVLRIASEYPNLAESFAIKNRLKRFNIFPVWGGAEVYPPENADLVLIAGKTAEELFSCNLVAVSPVLNSAAFLIANRKSWEAKDLKEVVNSIGDRRVTGEKSTAGAQAVKISRRVNLAENHFDDSVIRLALPDGHQQQPTVSFLNKVGVQVDDYPSVGGNRRPATSLEGVVIKVIRPQDMPLQVANGNFDLAITGRDWLKEHLSQFPSSPVVELLDLGFGKVKIVAVVSNSLAVSDIYDLRQINGERSTLLRVASEYVNIADKYARDNHLGMYRVIPTWGATEAFLPEDADLLIENTQTGRTLAKHNLKIIDTLFESTACLIGDTKTKTSADKAKRIRCIIEILQAALENTN